MWLPHRKAKIIDWWIADRKSLLSFKNILSGEKIKGDLRIVGYWTDEEGKYKKFLRKSLPILLCTTKRIVYINKKGVLTSDMTFYPFKQAHPYYLNFIIEANQPSTIIAYNWYKTICQKIIANVIVDGIDIKEIYWDNHTPQGEEVGMFKRYSPELQAFVVFSLFDRKDAWDEKKVLECLPWTDFEQLPNNTLYIDEAVSSIVKADIYNTLIFEDEKLIKQVKNNFKRKIKRLFVFAK